MVKETAGDVCIFQKFGVLQFRCKRCDHRVTWSKWRTGGYSDCLVDRNDCQGRMMAARCPRCGQLYAKRKDTSQCVPNNKLEPMGGAA